MDRDSLGNMQNDKYRAECYKVAYIFLKRVISTDINILDEKKNGLMYR